MTAPTTPSPERQPADAGVEAILDCPFCGDAAHLDYDTDTEMFGVEAEHAKGCILKNWDFRFYADEHAAINAWNRRPPAPQAQPDARAVEALKAANEALALVTAFESDARYIMGNTNFTILQQRREQVKKALQALSAPADDDGWRPSREEVARIVNDAIRQYEDHPAQAAFDAREEVSGNAADRVLALHPAAPTDEVGK